MGTVGAAVPKRKAFCALRQTMPIRMLILENPGLAGLWAMRWNS
jgi:hypothetical protein